MKKKGVYEFLINGIIILTLFSFFIESSLSYFVNIRIHLSVIRLIFIILLYFITLTKLTYSDLILLVFSIFVLMRGILADKIIPGLYYFKIYVEPILFAIALSKSCRKTHVVNPKIIIWIFYFIIIISLFESISKFGHLSFYESFYAIDVAEKKMFLPGTDILRNITPLGGSNRSGFVLTFILIFVVEYGYFNKNIYLKRHVKIIVIGLLLSLIFTFSRNAILSFLIYLLFRFVLQRDPNSMISSITLVILIGLSLFFVYQYLPDEFINNFKYWLNVSLSLSDSSSLGHIDSINNTLRNLNEYFLYGYDVGTVGAKAIRFGTMLHNVENSFLLVLMDIGIFGFTLYFTEIYTLLKSMFHAKEQKYFLFSVFFGFMIIPYVFEPEVIIVFFFIYCLMGEYKLFGSSKTVCN